jgi:hypothetical protein
MLQLAPTLSASQVLGFLQSTARAFPAPCSGCGSGIVNARAALDAAAPVGGGPNTININDVSLEGTTGTYNTQAIYQLTALGDVSGSAPSCTPSCGDMGDWITPKTNTGNYQARAINNGCTYTSGVSLAFNTWYSMTGAPQWGLNVSSVEPGTAGEACSMTIQITAVANPSVILDSATVSFNIWTGP